MFITVASFLAVILLTYIYWKMGSVDMLSDRASFGAEFPNQDGSRGMTVEALINVLGDEAAEALMFYWGGARVSVPDIKDLKKMRSRERIMQAYYQGATSAQVAELFGISIRTAQRLRNLAIALNVSRK